MFQKRKYYSSPRKSIWLSYILFIIDIFVDFIGYFHKKRKNIATQTSAPTFLISSFGHLGDALMLSYIFPIIKEKYPFAKIDLLVGDWCMPVLEKNNYINEIFIINHFFTNRSKISLLKKIQIHIATSIQTIKKLRKNKYDFSIDIRYTTATSHYIQPFINVKKSIGYNTAGFGGLLDKEFTMDENRVHLLDMIGDLIAEAGVKVNLNKITPYFPTETPIENLSKKLNSFDISQPYILMFPETGEPLRALSKDFWIAEINKIIKETNFRILVCGQKQETQEWENEVSQKERISLITSGLNLYDLASLAKNAQYALTLESFPAHLCTIYTHTICFFKDGSGFTYFPIAEYQSTIFHNDTNSINLSLKNLDIRFIEEFRCIEILDLLKKDD